MIVQFSLPFHAKSPNNLSDCGCAGRQGIGGLRSWLPNDLEMLSKTNSRQGDINNGQ